MGLVRLCIKHPVTVAVFFILAVSVGWFSLSRLPIDLFPEIDYPVLVVRITYPGVAPQEMETLVTEKVEEALASVEDIKKITSRTSEGESLVILEFHYGIDIDFASLHVRDKLDQIAPSLPDEADDPVTQKFDPAAFPVLDIQLSGDDLRALREYADDVVKPRLERVSDVAAAVVSGGLEREIRVPVSPLKLAARNLTIMDVVDAIDRENVNEPGGRVDEGRREITVRTLGEYESVEEIGEVLVARIGDADVKVKDLTAGGVLDTHKEVRHLARMNLKPSVSLAVMKQSGANSVAIADAVKAELERIRETLPPGYEIRVGMDMTEFIKDSITVVKQNAVGGAVLAALVLLLFLRSLRSTAVIIVAIPVSIITAFFPMYFLDMTLNLVTLGGLALGVGMVVDNSIVVLESAYRHIRRKGDRHEGALTGATEVMLAMVASTLTTLAVFFPILFIKGLVGQIFSNLALVIFFSLGASLVVGIMLVPVLASRLLRPGGSNPGPSQPGGLWGALLARYGGLLRWVAASGRNRWIVAGAVIALLVLTFKFLVPPMAFFPHMDRGELSVRLELPVGSTLQHTDEISLRAEETISRIPEVDRLTASVSPAAANIHVMLVDQRERTRTTKEVMAEVRRLLAELPDCEVRVSEPQRGGGGGGEGFSIEVKGDDTAVLERLCEEIARRVQGIPGLEDIRTSFEEGRPELRFVVDRDRAADLGVSVKAISDVVRAAVGGKVASYFRDAGEEYDIRVQFAEEARDFLDDLEQIYVRGRDNRLVPLSAVVRKVPAEGPVTINRKEQQRLGYVQGEVDLDRLGEVVAAARERLEGLAMPEGYSYAFGGEEEERVEAFGQLGVALAFAVFLVFLILAAQFESFSQPLLVMTTVPFSVVGVFVAMRISGLALSLPAYVGIIMLAGIVVNNAILLVDYTNRLRREGRPVKEAVVEAGLVRIRPVLTTSMTTVFGLLPLALGLGSGSKFLQPLAIAVVGGLTVAMLVTLVLIPTGYLALDAGIQRVRALLSGLFVRVGVA